MKKIGLATIAIFALLAGFIVSQQLGHKTVPQFQNLTWLGEQSRPLPDFKLIDFQGQRFDTSRLQDRWTLMFFGYTQCPDICPDTLHTVNQMSEQMDAATKEAVQVVFVSVDPARDSPQHIKAYLEFFNSDFIGATASMEHLIPLTRSLGIVHYIEEDAKLDEPYEVAHSASIVLINPKAQFAGLLPTPHDPAQMAADLKAVVDHHS